MKEQVPGRGQARGWRASGAVQDEPWSRALSKPQAVAQASVPAESDFAGTEAGATRLSDLRPPPFGRGAAVPRVV